jgi:hypothetical protein
MLRNKTSATIGSIANSTTRQVSSLRKPLHSRVDYNQFNYCEFTFSFVIDKYGV